MIMLTLEKVECKYFIDIYKDMCTQFPPSELKPFDVFERLLCDEKKNYLLLQAREDQKTAGYLIMALDNEQNALWLDYIAIYKEFHSSGYGSRILETLKNTYKDYMGIYLEVEKADEKDINTLRRIKFYTRLGAKKIDCLYFYPNKEGCLEMDLYFLPFQNAFPDRKSIKASVENIFFKLHSELPHLNKILNKIIIHLN